MGFQGLLLRVQFPVAGADPLARAMVIHGLWQIAGLAHAEPEPVLPALRDDQGVWPRRPDTDPATDHAAPVLLMPPTNHRPRGSDK